MESSTMIEAHITTLISINRADTTIFYAERCLRQADRELKYGLPVASRQEIETWLAHRVPRDDPIAAANWQPWSTWTRINYYGHLRRFFTWATDPDDPWISMDPMRGIKPPSAPKGIPHPMPIDLAHWAVTEAEQPFRRVCILAAYAGLRRAEITRLHREHITQSMIRVISGKGDKDALLPCHPAIWAEVCDLPPGPLIHRPAYRRGTSGELTPDWVGSSTNRYLKRHGIPDTIHSLRHLYVTEAHRQTGDLLKTQKLARHASSDTTAGYAFIDEDLSAIVFAIAI
jgi:integrase